MKHTFSRPPAAVTEPVRGLPRRLTLLVGALAIALAGIGVGARPARADADDILRFLAGAIIIGAIVHAIDDNNRPRYVDRWVLPDECLETIRVRYRDIDSYNAQCLRRAGYRDLPDRCRRDFSVNGYYRTGFVAECLYEAGFRAENTYRRPFDDWRFDDRPFDHRPGDHRPRGRRPGGDWPRDDRPGDHRPGDGRPHGDQPFGDRPRGDRPYVRPPFSSGSGWDDRLHSRD